MTLCVLTLIITAATPSWGMTDFYMLGQRTGTATDMSGSTQIYGPGASGSSSTTLRSIGFTFYFDNVAYSTFSASASGLMSLGRTTYALGNSHYWPNLSTINAYYPLIAGYWIYLGAPKSSIGKVHYKVTGTSPNRVLTVEWKDVYHRNGTSTIYPGGTWQVRLYEGSNAIEFWYGDMYTSTSRQQCNIGIARNATRYLNVWGNNLASQHYLYPSGQFYTYRYPQDYPISENTVFEIAPCHRLLTGLVGNLAGGGTATMQNGDDLLTNVDVMRGNTTGFQPFSFDMPTKPCQAWTYTVSFSGPAAGDYSVSPGNGTVITEGLAPTINFTPGGIGERSATMTINVSNGEKFTYDLKASGVSRIGRVGDIAEGGTAELNHNDELLTNIDVPRNMIRDLRPFTITNINTAPTHSPLRDANVSFTLDDPNDQYTVSVDGASTGINNVVTTVLAPGASTTPVIAFAPDAGGTRQGSGLQKATLTMNVDGEVFVYTLNGYSVAPAAEFYYRDERLIESARSFFVGETTCVAEEAIAGSFVIENINKVPVTINSIDVLMTENQVRQGAPPYPQMLDAHGEVIPMADYFITENSPIAPRSANTLVEFPLTVQPGERKTYYLAFVSQRPGKRFARIFLNTNAVNFSGTDVEGYMPNAGPVAQEEGIMDIHCFGYGAGSHLAKDQEGSLNGLALLFNPVKVGSSISAETWVHNTGDCDLRISKNEVRMVAGDVTEFELLEVLPNTTVDARGDYVIPPGGSDKITARFTPSRSGSRRASIMLKTNDSTLIVEGITDRGMHLLDVYGVGEAYMEARSIRLAPAIIDGAGSKGIVVVTNASTETVMITGATLSGPDVAEITPDPAMPWPSYPLVVLPGESLKFGVVLNTIAGSIPGPRSVTFEATLRDGDAVTAQITGLVGTRTIVANPLSMFSGVELPLGNVKREYAVVTNTGTFPVRVEQINIIGAGSADYSIDILSRMDLDPGESQFIEVTYAPSIPGVSSAQIEVISNATNGAQYIELGGAGTGTVMNGNPSSNGTIVNPGMSAGRTVAGESPNVAWVVPNPVRDKATISYRLTSDGPAEVALYDLSGRLVRKFNAEYEVAGKYEIQADLSELSGGTYYVTVRQNGEVSRCSLIVTD